MIRHAEFLERVISPEGTYPLFGRSITYRTAVFQALAQTALMDKLPEPITGSQVRCALTKVMHTMYDNASNFDSNGWLVLGFNGHQPMIADQYTSTGSLYMATLSFLPLGLPASHAFWTDVPAEWTSKKSMDGSTDKKRLQSSVLSFVSMLCQETWLFMFQSDFMTTDGKVEYI